MPSVDRVIFIVIDGLRPDGLAQAHTPHLDRMIKQGAYTPKARSVMPSITLPTHMSMFYSVPPEVHGVKSNRFVPNGQLGTGLVELIHRAGMPAAAFYSWEELRDLWPTGRMKFSWFLNIYSPPTRDFDDEVAHAAVSYITREPPMFGFVYLGMVDELAHHHGWMSKGYLQAVQSADAAVGVLLKGLEERRLLDGTAFLLQADHGGHDHGHGEDVPEDMTIPWLLYGAGVKKGHTIQEPVSILDTAPTIARLLGLTIPAHWEGRVVEEALTAS